MSSSYLTSKEHVDIATLSWLMHLGHVWFGSEVGSHARGTRADIRYQKLDRNTDKRSGEISKISLSSRAIIGTDYEWQE